MTKPFHSTSILSGEDAKNFLEPIVKEQENPSPTRLAFIREVLADSKKYVKG
ncbi:MAG: hypothetical protein AABX38_06660 [Candidatus Micrarchaeota archaeon]